MATNIINSTTGAKGYQTPGSSLPQGWQSLTPTPPAGTPSVPTSMIGTQPVNLPTITPTIPIAPTVPAPTGTKDANGNILPPPPVTSTTPAAPQTFYEKTLSQLSKLGDTLGTKSDVTQQLQADTQLAQKTEQATKDYNTYNQAKLDFQQQLEKLQAGDQNVNGAVGGGFSSSIQDFQRKGNANLANLAIISQASQGLLSAAQQTIKDKLDAQFQPITDQIDYLTKLSSVANNDLTESQKFQLQQKADQKKVDLTNLSKTADDLHQNLLQNNAPASAYSAIDGITNDFVNGTITAQQAQSKMYQAAGQYGVDSYKQTQTAHLLNEIATSGVTGDPTQTLAYAQQYASTGAIPTGLPKGTFGVVAQVAKELPKPEGTLVDINTGVKPSKLSGAQTDGIVALKDLSQKLSDAQTMFADLNTGFVAGAIKKITPTTDAQQRYDALKGEIVDLLARARTGAAINASEEKLYASKIPGTFNNSFFLGNRGDNLIQGLKDSIDGKLTTNLKTNGLSIYGYSQVKVGDKNYTVGDLISNGTQTGRVNPDGSITIVQ